MGNTDCPWCEGDGHEEDMERLDSDFEKALDTALEKVDTLSAGVERGWQEVGECEECGAAWISGEATVSFQVITKKGKDSLKV